jgi:hypothetical protein
VFSTGTERFEKTHLRFKSEKSKTGQQMVLSRFLLMYFWDQ